MSSKAVTKTMPSKAPSKTPQKPKAPSTQPKKTASTQPKKPAQQQGRGNWINRSVQGWIAGAGAAVGGGINAVGSGVSGAGKGIGDSVTGATRGWADGVRRSVFYSLRLCNLRTGMLILHSYGNAIKDATGSSGTRAITGSNPLGLAGARGTWAPSRQIEGPRNAGGGTASNPLGLK